MRLVWLLQLLRLVSANCEQVTVLRHGILVLHPSVPFASPSLSLKPQSCKCWHICLTWYKWGVSVSSCKELSSSVLTLREKIKGSGLVLTPFQSQSIFLKQNGEPLWQNVKNKSILEPAKSGSPSPAALVAVLLAQGPFCYFPAAWEKGWEHCC